MYSSKPTAGPVAFVMDLRYFPIVKRVCRTVSPMRFIFFSARLHRMELVVDKFEPLTRVVHPLNPRRPRLGLRMFHLVVN